MADEELSSGFIPSLFKPSSLLPIARHREALLYTVETFPVTIIIGETGSGKTTQLPQFLEQGGWCNDGKVIAVTQPRRVAATSVATRVAEEMGCTVGEDVGYSIRFEDVTSAKTRIKFLTDGLLLREALVDPLLSRYSVIMVDEAHERSLSTDILLGILKKIRKRRPELRIIISSATLQAEDFLNFFTRTEDSSTNGEAKAEPDSIGKIFYLSGRSYPVDIHHLEQPCEDYLTQSISTVLSIHRSELPGDILVFLTGAEEISNAAQSIADESLSLPAHTSRLLPLPLHAGLPTESQLAIFDPAPPETRKVIIATNIAEASLTIPGIVYVIDCGFVKQRAYNPHSAISTLTTTPISAASAVQRAGRAGRTKPGKCYRLYTAAAYAALSAHGVPEVQRSDLAGTVLQLKALGVENVARFGYVTAPAAAQVAGALEVLFGLGAVDTYGRLTRPLGTRMAEIGVEPRTSKALLAAAADPQFACASEMLSIAAMTQMGGSVWVDHGGDSRRAMDKARRRFAAEEGDHLTLLNVYAAFVGVGRREARWCHENYLNYKILSRAVSVRAQLKRYLERCGLTVEESLDARVQAQTQKRQQALDANVAAAAARPICERIRRCLTSGFFAQAARMQADGSFVTVNGGTTLWAHPTSLMFNRKADWVVFHEVVETGTGKTWIRDLSKIEKAWLLEYAPEFYSIKK